MKKVTQYNLLSQYPLLQFFYLSHQSIYYHLDHGYHLGEKGHWQKQVFQSIFIDKGAEAAGDPSNDS